AVTGMLTGQLALWSYRPRVRVGSHFEPPRGVWSGNRSDARSLLPMISYDGPQVREIWQGASGQLSRHIGHTSFGDCIGEAQAAYEAGHDASAQKLFTAAARAI